ncbi:hypothetical protein MTR_1g086570 [Medicago truncatula]|uniref:Uncharacterized protein n=1 Tax=Medicago truncatula TaxID=3880 RepID=G7ICU3_MEDTR|nr:hypothetical protein MTR_1g086570 [Medicago truncatula]
MVSESLQDPLDHLLSGFRYPPTIYIYELKKLNTHSNLIKVEKTYQIGVSLDTCLRIQVLLSFLFMAVIFEINTAKGIIGLSHDQVALFKTFRGTTLVVQGRLTTTPSPG